MAFQTCKAYHGKKYYLAIRKNNELKWAITPYSFLINYNSTHLSGQFITTNWFNMFCLDKTPINVIILAISKDASKTEKQEIARYLNTHNTSPYMIYQNVVDENMFANAFDYIKSELDKIDKKNETDKSCKTYNIKLGNENIDDVTMQFVIQGSMLSHDKNKYLYTITLPNFQTRL
tara:strand:+ start:4883 stop:5410 length:528 start_codon:yes stop_codon:yes gene_type:complete